MANLGDEMRETVQLRLTAINSVLGVGETARSILIVQSNQNMLSKTKNVESKITFGQLILRKIIKTVNCHQMSDFKATMTKIQNSAGARWGSLQRSPRLPSWI